MYNHVAHISVFKYEKENTKTFEDTVAVEEPLEIKLLFINNGNPETKNISVTMRTPGNDAELAVGFLFTEGIITQSSQIKNIAANKLQNSITIELANNSLFNTERLNRNFYTTSSCGVCGKESIEAIKTIKHNSSFNACFTLSKKILQSLPSKLNQAQNIFTLTGGIHASALFDLNGNLLSLREDVGRHNALDKLIGNKLMENKIPLSDYIILLSGRASFELIQKAVMAGICMVAAVGAPSSLAVELAKEFNVTLIGFLREDRFNVYSGVERIVL